MPRKNLRLLGGKPLVSYALDTALRAERIDKVVLSSDDDEILAIGRSRGCDIPLIRPPELGGDTVSLVQVNAHVYEHFRRQGHDYDAVMSIQPTCPFMKSSSLDRMVDLWLEERCDSVTTVAEVTQGHPYITKELLSNRRIVNFVDIPEGAVLAPSNKRKTAYYITGGCYLRDKTLIEAGNFKYHVLGEDACGLVVDDIQAVDINSEMDFMYAQFLLDKGMVGPEDNT